MLTISPAIETTPSLESFFPLYYEDLTEEQKQSGVNINVVASATPLPDGYTFTLIPTSDTYAGIGGVGSEPVAGSDKGEAVSAIRPNVPFVEKADLIATTSMSAEDNLKFVEVKLTIESDEIK